MGRGRFGVARHPPVVSSEFAGDPKSGPDADSSVAEYHASRARYIRTVTSDAEKRLMETIGKRREHLTEEMANLSLLAQSRYEIYQGTLKTYAAKAPSRVKGGALLSPGPAERMVAGIDKLYKAALKAAEEFREVDGIIKKRKQKLEEMDAKLRVQIEQYGRDLIAQLETPAGLESAFKRDPLLGRAHARMLAAQARRAAVTDVLMQSPEAAAAS
jgi:hypothetical protein